jgi:hypothetical protein
MPRKVIAALAAVVLAALSCNLTGPGSSSPPSSVGGGSSPAAPTKSNVLFHDDFSDPNSGWDHSSTENGTADYASGGYEIHVKATNLSKWANPGKGFQDDVRLEVDAAKVGGPDDNAFGVLCRYQDENNTYRFLISSDSYAGIAKMAKGDITVISSSDGQLQEVKGINTGEATNHIRADCIGDTLRLYVNGTQVATATDSSFTGGDVGLIVRTYDTAGADIVFKNFYVYSP